ncbi:hypothetical protein [Komagataeibacter sp. NFXK3]
MDLIIGTGTVAEASRDTMPATGTPGWATDGNPAATIPATDFPAAHYNMLMAEVIQPILDAGLTLDPANWGQLSAAIKALAKQAASGAVLGSPGVLATGDVAGSVLYYSAAKAAPAFTYGSTTVWLATTAAVSAAISGYLPLGGGNVTGNMDWGSKTAASTVTHRFWSAGAPTTGNATPDATLTATGGTPGTANAGTLALKTGTLDLSGVKSTLVPDAAAAQNPVPLGQLQANYETSSVSTTTDAAGNEVYIWRMGPMLFQSFVVSVKDAGTFTYPQAFLNVPNLFYAPDHIDAVNGNPDASVIVNDYYGKRTETSASIDFRYLNTTSNDGITTPIVIRVYAVGMA